jgi:hypothetical protein
MDRWADEGTADRATDVALEPCRQLHNLPADRLFWHGPTRFLQRRLALRDRQSTSSHSMRITAVDWTRHQVHSLNQE